MSLAYCQNGIMIAATNHQELLDDAIWRRFQTILEVPKPEIREIELLFEQITSSMDISCISKKHLSIVIEQLKGLSYSDIQTLTQNVIKQKIIKNERTLSAFDFMREIAIFRYHGNVCQEDMIRYFLRCSFSQRSIAEYFRISQRQVRNCLPKGDE